MSPGSSVVILNVYSLHTPGTCANVSTLHLNKQWSAQINAERDTEYLHIAQKASFCWAGWRSATGSMYVCIRTIWFPPQLGLHSQSAQWLAHGHTNSWGHSHALAAHKNALTDTNIHKEPSETPLNSNKHPTTYPYLSLRDLPSPRYHTDLVAHLVWTLLALTHTIYTLCHGHPCPWDLMSHSSFWHWHSPTGLLAASSTSNLQSQSQMHRDTWEFLIWKRVERN